MLAFTTSPKPAKHGKSLIAGLAVNESDTGGPVQAGTVACTATIALKHVTTSAHGLKNGIAALFLGAAEDVEGQDDSRHGHGDRARREGLAQLQRQDHVASASGVGSAGPLANGRACRRGRRELAVLQADNAGRAAPSP